MRWRAASTHPPPPHIHRPDTVPTMPAPRPSPRFTPDQLRSLCEAAIGGCGGSPELARTLAAATVEAEVRGKCDVGAAHLLDFLDALSAGRLNGRAEPIVHQPRTAAITVDADDGTAHLAFARAQPQLVQAARDCGIGVASVTNSYPAGELAHYAIALAREGLIALVAANSPALMSLFGSSAPIAGTNPIAFAVPHPSGPRVFDQASSATAWVRVRDAARRGEPIPQGWALGPDGVPTTDARAALQGALLPFGGAKGANIAAMIEVLAAMSGGAFSLDAPPFDAGERPPRLGMCVIAIDPTAFSPDYEQRAEAHFSRLAAEHGADVGRRRPPRTTIDLPEDLHDRLLAVAGRAPHPDSEDR